MRTTNASDSLRCVQSFALSFLGFGGRLQVAFRRVAWRRAATRGGALGIVVAFALVVCIPEVHAECSRFPPEASSAYDSTAQKITLPWRTDLPSDPGNTVHAWQALGFGADWKAYIASVLAEVKAAGVAIQNHRIQMNPDAEWWIAPWMDFGRSGRERINGLTSERGPDARDLSPTSPKGYQTWAIGWYNRAGAFGLGQVYADPCNPRVPSEWHFPDQTASFKLLFSNADTSQVSYLDGAPEVEADVQRDPQHTSTFRLIQVDVAVRDPRAIDTGWVMGTFVWKGPPAGDGLFDNLVPVGLMWGNDEGVVNPTWSLPASVTQSQINNDLAGILWQGHEGTWPERPYPGFQGRLNGPADNLRSSCLSCHSMAQWRRGPLGLTPTYKLDPPPTSQEVSDLVSKYFRNVRGGQLVDPTSGQTSLDYSLQLEASFLHLCDACNQEKLAGQTPYVCQVPQMTSRDVVISRPTCEKNVVQKVLQMFAPKESQLATNPRQ